MIQEKFVTRDVETMVALRNRFVMQRKAFDTRPFSTVGERRRNLNLLIDALREYQEEIVLAVNSDFGVRSPSETLLVEVMGPILQAQHAIRNLKKWMKPEKRSTELLFTTNFAKVEYQPKGVVGILGAWNFPLFVTIGPLVAALAAGNRAMIKMSEYMPKTTEVLEKMLESRFSVDLVSVFGGGVEVSKEFNALPFDHIIFTGSPVVGREVMKSASNNLTPVTLELGGKCPVIVDIGANVAITAERIAHGKAFNAGQICVAPDYVFVPRGMAQTYSEEIIKAYARLYPQVKDNYEYTAIISNRHYSRLQSILEDASKKGALVIKSAEGNELTRQMPLHVILGATTDMLVLKEEIFGPILPILEYDHFEDAVNYIRKNERPLACYGFGMSSGMKKWISREIHSGGITFDHWGWHAFQHDLPFGGIGGSGMGSYHGIEGFRQLSHAKSILSFQRLFPISLFYPPYGNFVQRFAMWLYLRNINKVKY